MSEQANAFRLGLFVIVATGLLVAGATFLGAWSFMRETVPVETYFDDAIDGLEVGAAVKHRGVTIGRVSHIGFVYQRYPIQGESDLMDALIGRMVLVQMELFPGTTDPEIFRESVAASVDIGLRARIQSSGLLGATYVELALLDPARNPVMDLKWTPETVFIPATSGLRAQLFRTVEEIAHQFEQAQIGDVIEKLGRLLTALDGGVEATDLAALGSNASALVAELRESNARLKTILDDDRVEPMISDLAGAASTLHRIAEESEGDVRAFVRELPMIAERAQRTLERIEVMTASDEFEKFFADLNRLAEESGPVATEARLLLRRMNTLLADQQRDLETIVSDLQRVLTNAAVIMEDMKKNPSRFFFGEPPVPVNPPR